jgi:hypothetical protein
LTGGIRKGAKGEPPVAIFYSFTSRAASFLVLLKGSVNFFLSSTEFLAYDTIPEEIYLSG